MEYISIDIYLERKEDFWLSLQYHCVFECCGLDAYEFSFESIKDNLKQYSAIEIEKDLNDMLRAISLTDKEFVSSYLFNCSLKKDEFIKMIKDIIQIVSEIKNS